MHIIDYYMVGSKGHQSNIPDRVRGNEERHERCCRVCTTLTLIIDAVEHMRCLCNNTADTVLYNMSSAKRCNVCLSVITA